MEWKMEGRYTENVIIVDYITDSLEHLHIRSRQQQEERWKVENYLSHEHRRGEEGVREIFIFSHFLSHSLLLADDIEFLLILNFSHTCFERNFQGIQYF
jgi:hypothetical protein